MTFLRYVGTSRVSKMYDMTDLMSESVNERRVGREL